MRRKKLINIEIGKRIQDRRKDIGYTQEKFAELLDLSTQYVSDVERGVAGISLETLISICKILTISSDRILFGMMSNDNTQNLTERLQHVPPEHFIILNDMIENIINKYIELEAVIKEENSQRHKKQL